MEKQVSFAVINLRKPEQVEDKFKTCQNMLANIVASMIQLQWYIAIFAKNGFATVAEVHQDRILSIIWSEPNIKKSLCTKMDPWAKQFWNVIRVVSKMFLFWDLFQPRPIPLWCCFVVSLAQRKIL